MIAHALLAVLAAARRFLRGILDASVALACEQRGCAADGRAVAHPVRIAPISAEPVAQRTALTAYFLRLSRR
jgi:hypothetical protein